MPTEGEILESTGNLIEGINGAFTARQPVQDQLDQAQRQIQAWINSLPHMVMEIHARRVTHYAFGDDPRSSTKSPTLRLDECLLVLVMEVEELRQSASLQPCLRLRGLVLGPRTQFCWVDIWQSDISVLRYRNDVKKLLEAVELQELSAAHRR